MIQEKDQDAQMLKKNIKYGSLKKTIDLHSDQIRQVLLVYRKNKTRLVTYIFVKFT